MKLIIAGSRGFNNYYFLKEQVTIFLATLREPFPEIISGGASGADTYGEWYAKERGLKIIRMPANWNKYGRAAGPIRNEEMAKIADACIIFWDGKSAGSRNMIDMCVKYNLKYCVITTIK